MRYTVEELKSRAAAIGEQAGIPAADAETIAEVLVTTDMRGVHSHGVVRIARYLDCIRAGGIRPDAEIEVLKESPSSLMVSAAGGLGIPAAKKTMDRLLAKAADTAIAVATVNHSDHYGAAGYYSMMAADRGFVGFSMSNTCPLVAPTGGRAAAIGNNPFAYSAPGSKYRAVLFDICMSKVAAGKLLIAAVAGAEDGHVCFLCRCDQQHFAGDGINAVGNVIVRCEIELAACLRKVEEFHCGNIYVRIDIFKTGFADIDLILTDIRIQSEDLSVDIRDVDFVAVDDRYVSDTRSCKAFSDISANAANAEKQHSGI